MAAQNFLHVHTSMDIVRKPASMDELKTMMRERFKMDFDFSLSYEDPDFDGAVVFLCRHRGASTEGCTKSCKVGE